MLVYEPDFWYLWEFLIFCFNVKIYAAEAHWMHPYAYGFHEDSSSERECLVRFICFNHREFIFKDRHNGGRGKNFEDTELQALLNEESCQSQE